MFNGLLKKFQLQLLKKFTKQVIKDYLYIFSLTTSEIPPKMPSEKKTSFKNASLKKPPWACCRVNLLENKKIYSDSRNLSKDFCRNPFSGFPFRGFIRDSFRSFSRDQIEISRRNISRNFFRVTSRNCCRNSHKESCIFFPDFSRNSLQGYFRAFPHLLSLKFLQE